jgi:methionyl-tRNA formyltransferase
MSHQPSEIAPQSHGDGPRAVDDKKSSIHEMQMTSTMDKGDVIEQTGKTQSATSSHITTDSVTSRLHPRAVQKD